MADNLYGPKAQSYKQLPIEAINKKGDELARVVNIWANKYNKATEKGSTEDVSTIAGLLSPYTSSSKIRKVLMDSLEIDWIRRLTQRGGIYTTRDIYRVLAPWREIFPDVDRALRTANPDGQLTQETYSEVRAYSQITQGELSKFRDYPLEQQQDFFRLRIADIATTGRQVLENLLFITFSPRKDYHEEVKRVGKDTFLCLIDRGLVDTKPFSEIEIPKDYRFPLRMARGLESICSKEPLKLSDEFIESLLVALFKEEWLKSTGVLKPGL